MATLALANQRGLQELGISLWLRARQNSLLLIAVGLTLWLIVVPLAVLLLSSFRTGTPWSPGPLTLENYVVAYSNPQTYRMLMNTAAIATVSTALSLVVAVFFAYLTERTDMPLKSIAWGLIVVPLAVPGLLYGISWTFLLSPTIGIFNVILRSMLSQVGVELSEGPLNVYSLGGIIFLEGLRGATTVFLMVVGAFRAMDPSLEEAATMSGSARWTTFFRVFVPLLTPALFAAGMYNFMSNLESLEIPLILGVPSGIHVFSTYIFFTAQRFAPPQYGMSAALGATFLCTSLLLVYAYRCIAGRAERFATITGKGYRPRLIELGPWRYPALGAFAIYFLLTIGAPLCILLWLSLHRFYVPPSLDALSRVTFQNFSRVFEHPSMLLAVVNTLSVGFAAAILTMVLSLIVSWALVRGRFRGRLLLDGLTFLPHAIPGVVVAIALIYLYLQPPMSYVPIYGTIWVIVLGISVGYLAFGTRAMNGAVAQLHSELEEAALTSGATWRQMFGRVVLPLLLPSFISGWIWVAANSLRSFSVPLLVGSRESVVISILMWNFWDQGQVGQAAALGVLLIVTLALFTAGGRWLVTRLSPQPQG